MRIVIVEDSDVVHAALLEVLGDCAGVEVVGRAIGEGEAIALIAREAPDVVLLDLTLSPGSGLAVLRAVRDQGSTARIFVLSNEVGHAIRLRCLEYGADAFFDKCTDLNALLVRLQESGGAQEPSGFGPSPRGTAEARHALDRIVERAIEITGCPMAAVSVVGVNRQWFISRAGIAIGGTSRHVAFCAHTMAGEDVLEIVDTRLDPRFADNPLTDEPVGLRYYAGAPLRLASGRAVGALCVLDTATHRLTPAERDALKALARTAAEHLEHVQVEAIADCEERMRRGGAPDVGTGHDALTGLLDRTGLHLHAAQRLAVRVPGNPRPGLLLVGIDRLGWVNHHLGRAGGDALLREVARRIRGATAAEHAVARIEGDNFGVFLPEVASESELLSAGEAIAQSVAEPLVIGGSVLRIRCSVGMALGSDDLGIEALATHADLAMKQAKNLGGDLCQIYSDWMGTHASERVVFAHDLRRAITLRQLELDFQPQVGLADEGLVGLEALVRWNHPQRGRLAPYAFIPLAEETGLIHELGDAVLDTALAQVARWRLDGLTPPRVAVNVSPLQLVAGFEEKVMAMLARHGVEPGALELELTESTLPKSDAIALGALRTLHAAGVSIAVDDFGIGHSSLSTLRRTPVSTLKIDRSFVVDVQESSQASAIVEAVVALARALGLRTVAEGIELPAQADRLAALGCERAQGFLFSRPLSPAATAQLLEGCPAVTTRPRAARACARPEPVLNLSGQCTDRHDP